MTETVPAHDCPIQGNGTPLVRIINIKTNEIRWTCIWCAMAAHMGVDISSAEEQREENRNG